MYPMNAVERRAKFRHLRAHGKSVEAAADAVGVEPEKGYRWEGKRWCSDCGDYVRFEDCPHWDYESE